MSQEGPVLCGAGTDDGSVGTQTWVNPGNITLDDGSGASVVLTSTSTSHYLKGLDYGFTEIPDGAVVNGVEFKVQKSASTPVTDSRVRMVKGGVIGDAERRLVGEWPGTTEEFSYGAPDDDWEETLTGADVKAADFGLVLSVVETGGLFGSADVDCYKCTVYYTADGVPGIACSVLGWS